MEQHGWQGFDNHMHLPIVPPEQNPNAVPDPSDVRLKVLPFYDVKGELLKPSSLVPRGGAGVWQEDNFVFHLTTQQANDITMSRDSREYLVQLRFCLLETSSEQEDNFPPSVFVQVNDVMATLPAVHIPSLKPGVEPRQVSGPVDITPLCRLSPTTSNHVEVSWASGFGRGYCVAIYLVRRLSADILFSRLKQRCVRHPYNSRALIKEKLYYDPVTDIEITNLSVSLSCPLGKMKIQNPCRASTCKHLQCFDAMTFLMMNEKKATWICPLCDKPAPFDQLIIDEFFVEILEETMHCGMIQLFTEIKWKPMTPIETETVVISSPMVENSSNGASSSLPKQPEIITISDSE